MITQSVYEGRSFPPEAVLVHGTLRHPLSMFFVCRENENMHVYRPPGLKALRKHELKQIVAQAALQKMGLGSNLHPLSPFYLGQRPSESLINMTVVFDFTTLQEPK